MIETFLQLGRFTEYPNKYSKVNDVISFDNKITIDNIHDFENLPEQVQAVINRCDSISFIGWQELCGYVGRQCIFSAMYHDYSHKTIVIESIGFHDEDGTHYCYTPIKGLYKV